MRWKDCVKRDVRKAGEEEDWKKKTRDGGGWKRLSDEAVKKCRAGSLKGKRGRETAINRTLVCYQPATNSLHEYHIVSVPLMVRPYTMLSANIVPQRSMPVVVGIHSALTCWREGGSEVGSGVGESRVGEQERRAG